jgi:hypothetical protein
MKKASLAFVSLLLLGALPFIWAQTPSSQAPSKMAPTAKAPEQPMAPPQTLSPAESFEVLNTLNEAEKLFPESYLMPLTAYKNLKEDNCFGVHLATGKRLLGESSGKSYGMRGKVGDSVFVVIGVLYSEFPFSIDDHPLPAGPYVVHAFKDALELWGNAEKGTHYDPYRRKNVPSPQQEKFPLKVALPDALLAEKAIEIPRFALAVEKGSIMLSFHGNSWKVLPR